MEIRQLKALVAVADTGSVTRAAQVLHLVQPAVTRHIATLEDELGTQLFERSRAGMLLTEVGEQVLERARRALREIERAKEVASTSDHSVSGHVSVGLLPSVARVIGPRLSDAIVSQHPGLQLQLTVGYAGHLAKWLEGGAVDFAILFDQPMSSAFSMDPVAIEDLWAIAPPGSLEDTGAPIPLEHVLSQPMIIPNPPHGLRTLIDVAAARLGITPSVTLETNDATLQRALVADKLGWSMLPASMATAGAHGDEVIAVPTTPSLTRTLTLVRPRGRMSAAEAVVHNALLDAVTAMVDQGLWTAP
ncbi:LysR substrate-binding domain-containing protein [Rhodococcus opacus]|uniref:Putative LysR family transcriptional regulator n=1 Tax=Rhodococcus opacus (strain B4) TaxID=632772 RepID=C1B6M2_RHOOB|nr:LysR substrate-binding domain-containing protein [Rhodococcus opacus]BAH51325.1 putative LysR family transcriptional regulator [Rhodococcus opacus B4]